MMTHLFKQFLFSLDPERAHYLALQSLQLGYRLNLTNWYAAHFSKPITCMGLQFPNPIGLAAGFDKNADYVDALAALGFGFIEVGTITPLAQAGNPRPRLFRLNEDHAIINRMGFNNKGADYAVSQLRKISYRGILGINIGKNRDTPLEQAIDDYVFCFEKLYDYASYITVNISSPNTQGLRSLQEAHRLDNLLASLRAKQKSHTRYVPLVVKISPDLSNIELNDLADIFLQHAIDGVIATNTTLSREGLRNRIFANEAGGLSGTPLFLRSTAVLQQLSAYLDGKIPIIASGGVMDASSAREKLRAGASLLQVYSGFIFHGPKIIDDVAKVF